MKTLLGKLSFLAAFAVAATLVFLTNAVNPWFYPLYLLVGGLIFWLSVRGKWKQTGSSQTDVVTYGAMFSICWLLLIGAWMLFIWHTPARRLSAAATIRCQLQLRS